MIIIIKNMTVETMSNIIIRTLKAPDWEKLKAADKDYGHGQVKAFVSLIPYVGGVAAEELQRYYDYKDDEFFRKFTRFLIGMAETSDEERTKFAEELQQKADDYSGNVIMGMVDRLDNINKEAILAKLSVARMHGEISIEDFFRLHTLLERIPYVDLKELPRYKEPFYDKDGDTELLFATGALEFVSIDTKGGSNKYVLSRLGEMLLRWGFNIHLELEHGKGTNVELDVMSNEDVEEIVRGGIEASRPIFKDNTLYFPDGAKSGALDDDGAFLYDLARGK